jgi:hypothetical protein
MLELVDKNIESVIIPLLLTFKTWDIKVFFKKKAKTDFKVEQQITPTEGEISKFENQVIKMINWNGNFKKE